jgi:endoglucanase
MLRGVSLFWSQWMPQFYNGELVRWLARDWHTDVIRVPVGAAAPGYLSDPEGELAKTCAVVEAAIEAGIYVLVDWHAHEPWTEEARTFFGTIARRYGDCPNILYESWNEPPHGLDWASAIVPHHLEIIDTIRGFAPQAPIVLGTPDYCTDLEAAAAMPVPRENLGYTLHFYAATHREGLRQRVDRALGEGISLFATEWGIGEADGNGVLDFDEAARWLDFLDRRCIPHANWAISDKEEACAALRAGASPSGGWRRRQLSRSGAWVRLRLRSGS